MRDDWFCFTLPLPLPLFGFISIHVLVLCLGVRVPVLFTFLFTLKICTHAHPNSLIAERQNEHSIKFSPKKKVVDQWQSAYVFEQNIFF